jgi:ATP-binding cassette subfamily B protein
VFGAIQPVKLAGAEQRVVDHLQSLHDHRGRSATKDRVFNSTLEAVWGSFHTVGTGLILLLAANAMRSGSFTLGDFTLFVSYLGIVSELPKLVGSLIASYGQVGVALGRLNELGPNRNLGELFEPTKVYLDEDPPDISRPNVLQGDFGSLQVEGLTYQYPGSGRGVFDATLEVQQGDFVVITGRVGSGKSTLLRALVGLHSATSGSVKIDGQLVEERAKQRQSNVFAFVSQDPRLFSESIRNNILSGFEDDRDELAETVHTAVLEQDLDALEDGIDTMVGRRGVTLSGGQVKRVATARSLFQRPDVLVMDDVSNALDSETETALFSRLADVRTVTVIVSSTRRSALLRANHIVVMKDGFVESQGSLAELLEHSGELREIWTTTIDDADSDSNRSGSAATQMN